MSEDIVCLTVSLGKESKGKKKRFYGWMKSEWLDLHEQTNFIRVGDMSIVGKNGPYANF